MDWEQHDDSHMHILLHAIHYEISIPQPALGFDLNDSDLMVVNETEFL